MSTDRNAAQVATNLRAVYSPTASELLAQLTEAAESAVMAVRELARDLTPERAERAAVHFGGMQRHAANLAETLKRTTA